MGIAWAILVHGEWVARVDLPETVMVGDVITTSRGRWRVLGREWVIAGEADARLYCEDTASLPVKA